MELSLVFRCRANCTRQQSKTHGYLFLRMFSIELKPSGPDFHIQRSTKFVTTLLSLFVILRVYYDVPFSFISTSLSDTTIGNYRRTRFDHFPNLPILRCWALSSSTMAKYPNLSTELSAYCTVKSAKPDPPSPSGKHYGQCTMNVNERTNDSAKL